MPTRLTRWPVLELDPSQATIGFMPTHEILERLGLVGNITASFRTDPVKTRSGDHWRGQVLFLRA